jgi:hypothetical protein
MDANQDGVITKSEWAAVGDFRFVYVDLNSDGVLTSDEVHTAYVSGYRYNGVLTVPDYVPAVGPMPSTTVTTYTYSFNGAPPYGYAPEGFQPYTYQSVISPPVAYVPAPGQPLRKIPDEAYQVPQYVLPGYPHTQRIVEEPSYSYSDSVSDGVYPGNPFALDSNRDGALTINEVFVYNDGNFQRHDTNRNGWIEDYEWDLKAQEHFGHRVNPPVLGTLTHDTFGRHDRDGDGRVSKLEWDAQIEAEFARLDSNGDRRLHSSDFHLASN